MKVNIEIDDSHEETSITIKAREWTEELEEIISIIKKRKQRVFGIENDQTIVLHPDEIDFVFAQNRKVYAAMEDCNIEIKMKLYEVEQVLKGDHFMRFSKSVVGNINNIDRFELSFNGNLCVYFHSGNKEYISRKYVSSIKEVLTKGGQTDDY